VESLKIAKEQAEEKQKYLTEKRDELKKVQQKVAELNHSFQQTQDLLNELNLKKKTSETHIDRAGKFLNGLKSQSETWNVNLKTLGVAKLNLKFLNSHSMFLIDFLIHLRIFLLYLYEFHLFSFLNLIHLINLVFVEMNDLIQLLFVVLFLIRLFFLLSIFVFLRLVL
jgi:hypothetical protein